MDATTVTLALIQKFVGPNNRINNLSDFYDALLKALEDAHSAGREEANVEHNDKAGDSVAVRGAA